MLLPPTPSPRMLAVHPTQPAPTVHRCLAPDHPAVYFSFLKGNWAPQSLPRPYSRFSLQQVSPFLLIYSYNKYLLTAYSLPLAKNTKANYLPTTQGLCPNPNLQGPIMESDVTARLSDLLLPLLFLSFFFGQTTQLAGS